ncbi:MAG: integrin alpha, partial [Candidatus Thermoplasmatota archaeon]
MKKLISLATILIILLSLLSIPKGYGEKADKHIFEFQTGGEIVDIDIIKLGKGNIKNASFNVSSMPYTENGTNYPYSPGIDIGNDGNFEWKYEGLGYGAFGYQYIFADGKIKDSFSKDVVKYIKIPKEANIKSANFSLKGYGGQTIKNNSFSGFGKNDNFGWSVAGKGDVNKDGFGDIVIGAPNNDAKGVDAGRVYIYYGGYDENVDVILTGSSDYDNFGNSVAIVGDLNKDGYDDVLVGAPQFGKYKGTGYAELFFGGSPMNYIPDIRFDIGNISHPELYAFGFSVSSAGDVNNDSYPDIIIGA